MITKVKKAAENEKDNLARKENERCEAEQAATSGAELTNMITEWNSQMTREEDDFADALFLESSSTI
jgi:hypothetical protein